MREHIDYAERRDFLSSAREIGEPRQGYFKIRLKAAGAWVPVRVWVEDGDRDPETWDLMSDQTWHAEWWPRTDSVVPYRAPYMRIIDRITPINKEEFEWLMILRQLPSQSQLPKR